MAIPNPNLRPSLLPAWLTLSFRFVPNTEQAARFPHVSWPRGDALIWLPCAGSAAVMVTGVLAVQRTMPDLPSLNTPRLHLAIPAEGDAPALLSYAVRNCQHLAPWSPPAPPGWNTLDNARRRAHLYQEQARTGVCYRFWARSEAAPDSDFVAAVTLSQVVLGPKRSCSLGYHVDAACEGVGYVTEAAKAVIDFAFRRLLLHRIEATYVPNNERSARVLARLGFEREGYAKEYLYVGGRFQDHVLTALTNRGLQNIEALCTPSS